MWKRHDRPSRQPGNGRGEYRVGGSARHAPLTKVIRQFGTGVEVLPRSGDVLHVTRAASVQFVEPMLFRVIRVHDWPTYDGWVWLDGYELNASGEAVERRSIFVQVNGLRQVTTGPD